MLTFSSNHKFVIISRFNGGRINPTADGLPPILAYRLPPKYPLTGDVAAYTNMDVLNNDPLLEYREQKYLQT